MVNSQLEIPGEGEYVEFADLGENKIWVEPVQNG